MQQDGQQPIPNPHHKLLVKIHWFVTKEIFSIYKGPKHCSLNPNYMCPSHLCVHLPPFIQIVWMGKFLIHPSPVIIQYNMNSLFPGNLPPPITFDPIFSNNFPALLPGITHVPIQFCWRLDIPFGWAPLSFLLSWNSAIFIVVVRLDRIASITKQMPQIGLWQARRGAKLPLMKDAQLSGTCLT